MRLQKLTSLKILPVVAQVHKNKTNNSLYYNIKHGTHGEGLWMYSCGLYKPYFTPENEGDKLEMKDDNYIIKPVKKDNVILRDKKKNVVYNITIDLSETHKKDIIVFWEIPNKNYLEVSFKVSGLATLLGEGISGKERGEVLYSSPAPVIEVLGDCELYWTGKDIENKNISQTIKYDYAKGEWDIQPIKQGV